MIKLGCTKRRISDALKKAEGVIGGAVHHMNEMGSLELY